MHLCAHVEFFLIFLSDGIIDNTLQIILEQTFVPASCWLDTSSSSAFRLLHDCRAGSFKPRPLSRLAELEDWSFTLLNLFLSELFRCQAITPDTFLEELIPLDTHFFNVGFPCFLLKQLWLDACVSLITHFSHKPQFLKKQRRILRRQLSKRFLGSWRFSSFPYFPFFFLRTARLLMESDVQRSKLMQTTSGLCH